MLENFFISSRSPANITVGGMTGSFVFKHALDAATYSYSFSDILVIEGCQDYIGISRADIANFIYYADIFVESYKNGLTEHNPFKPNIMNPQYQSVKEINVALLNEYKVIIVNDAQLIPNVYLNAIANNFCGKLCIVADPFDIGGEMFTGYPTIVDSLYKLSPLTAMARSMYGVNTRSIEKSLSGTVKEAKINKRSIGKMDDKQYISNIPEVINTVREKQLNASFRNNYKVLVVSDKIHVCFDKESRSHNITKNSILVISNATAKPFMRFRIYNYLKTVSGVTISYDSYNESIIQNDTGIKVVPANIISIEDSVYHKYKNAVLIEGEPINNRQRYSILKNCQSLTVSKM